MDSCLVLVKDAVTRILSLLLPENTAGPRELAIFLAPPIASCRTACTAERSEEGHLAAVKRLDGDEVNTTHRSGVPAWDAVAVSLLQLMLGAAGGECYH